MVDDDVFMFDRSVDVAAEVRGDLFAAGGWVDIDAEVADNVIVAGGLMDIAGTAAGDLIAAGGVVDVMAAVGDNLVITGGAITVGAPVGGKLFASAGRLRVGRDAVIAGDVWLAAGSGDVGGRISGDAVIAAGNVTLRGHITGDVEVTALSLEVAPGASIEGRLVYHGPDPPDVAEDARIGGGLDHRFEPERGPEPDDGPSWPSILWLLVVLGLGLVLDLVLPNYVRSAGERFLSQPIVSFGLGVVILLMTPVLILIAIVSVLGLAIGLVAIAAYGALLLLGPVAALYGVGDLALRHLRRRRAVTPTARRVAFVAALVVAGLLGWLPYVGAPLLWIVTVIGLGAATWQLYDSMRAAPRVTPGPGG